MKNSESILSSVLPFPNIRWWSHALISSTIQFDISEHFEKMSFRNRYYIATAHGKFCLSIPLVKGRNQRIPMKEVQISYAENWQQQHWRTLFSAYNRSPYFEYYKDALQKIFETKYDRLIDFNLASIHWLKNQLGLKFGEEFIDSYNKDHTIGTDLRKFNLKGIPTEENQPYYQVFNERNEFIPNLSALDLLFNEGRNAIPYLEKLSS